MSQKQLRILIPNLEQSVTRKFVTICENLNHLGEKILLKIRRIILKIAMFFWKLEAKKHFV